jgi:hypothetical protein
MISDIIEILSDDAKSLVTPLLKVKVLATRIGNEELLKWVNNELEGYENRADLPDYRVAAATPRANLQQGYARKNKVVLPISYFDEELVNQLVEYPFYQGVKALESIADGKSGDTIVKQFGDDFSAVLTAMGAKKGLPVRIVDAWTEVHVSAAIHSLSVIRTKLLELLLELEKNFPNIDEDVKADKIDKAKVNATIITIMNNFNTSGDGNVINTGDSNSFNTNISINKGDNAALQNELRKIGVADTDIVELMEILKTDKPNETKGTLGPETSGWAQKMIGKTLDKSWDFATGTAAGLLTELLKGYFGL